MGCVSVSENSIAGHGSVPVTSSKQSAPSSRSRRHISPLTSRMIELVLLVILWPVHTQAWSINNFMMTGPKALLTFSDSVASGAMLGMEECRYQFQWDRWNCPENSLPIFSMKALPEANKETAFVYSISAAGVMYMLTRNCSLGEFDRCGCDEAMDGGSGWKWGGCSDNVRFGERVSRQFLDAMEEGKDARASMNLHNNEAGRKAVKKMMKTVCKCHGVSGACTTRTCWRQLSDFRDVGDLLKRKHATSIQVDFVSGKLQQYNSANSNHEMPEISRRDLVYLEPAPDYCRVNLTSGSQGTIGRECLRDADVKTYGEVAPYVRRSCKRLCKDCGLKVVRERIQVVSSCNCKFHWCCHVKCEECVDTIVKLRCATRR
uniref:Protein Wnt n=1 Tax=Xenoturbella bocki TaxID=242395 RepID=A0A2P1DV68_XENBC|nr:Wnt8 protein [Xenoturbella bocki]